MAKLNVDEKHLNSIFEFAGDKNVITLSPNDDGSPRTSLNTQQLYNWYRGRQNEFDDMTFPNAIDGAGFIGLQPVIVFKNGLKIEVPDVLKFVVNGLIATDIEGGFPFIVEPETALIMGRHARPYANVFLSHSRKDKPFVRELRKLLYSVCETFFDETDIYPGQSITARLDHELSKSDLLVLAFSSNAAKSPWVRKEWASMLHLEKTIVVLRLDDEPILPLLIDIKYIDCGSDVKLACDEISLALGAIESSATVA